MPTACLRTTIEIDPSATRVAPTAFRLFARGTNKSDQGDFLWDEEAEASVMAAFNERGRELVIDYEHQSMAQPPVQAPAAGWFRLEARAGELWAVDVRWTEEARAQLQAAEYRYWSPTFKYDTKSGRVLEVFNNALTNNPSLYGIPALVAASQRGGEIMSQVRTCRTPHGEVSFTAREIERLNMMNVPVEEFAAWTAAKRSAGTAALASAQGRATEEEVPWIRRQQLQMAQFMADLAAQRGRP